jgi:hypothetical protein
VKEVFPSLVKQQKWFKYKRDTKVGDVVLKKDEMAAGQTYKYARVTKVHVGMDGKVRAADIEYKVPGGPIPISHENHPQARTGRAGARASD